MAVDEASDGTAEEAAPAEDAPEAIAAPRGPREVAGTLVGLVAALLCFVPGNPSLAPLHDAARARVLPRAILLVQVSDGAGAPVRGAHVEIEETNVRAAYTDVQGRARLEPPVRGLARITASGFARRRTQYEIRGRQGTLSVRLDREVLVTGRVVDEAGAPLGTASVIARLDATPNDPVFEAQTDHGAFRIPNLPAAKILVTASAPGFASESRLLDLADGPVSELVLVLERTGTLVARIVDANGGKADRAELELAGSGIYPAESRPSDANGVVRWEGVPQGIYEARARSDGFVSERVSPITITPGAEVEITLTLAPAVTLAGTVQDAAGVPIAGAQILASEDVLELSPREVTSDAEGRFTLEGLLAKPHFVVVRSEGYLPFGPQEVTPGGDPLAVTLERAATIRGRVVDSLGHPVMNALVEIVGDRLPSLPRAAAGQPVGTGGPTPAPLPGTPLQGAGELGVTLGSVPAIPLGNAPLGANPPGLMRVPTGVAMLGTVAAVTSSDGIFVIEGVPSGTIQLAVQHPAHPPTWTSPRTVASGRTIEGWEIVLPESGAIDGRVLDGRGMPVPGVLVELTAERETVPRTVITARDGGFVFEAVLGNVVLTAMPSGAPAGRTRAQVRANARTEVTITLEGALFSMDGRVLDPRGFPVEGAQISIASLRARTPYEAATFSARDGTFSFLAMPRPPFHLTVDHPDFARFDEPDLTPPTDRRPYEAHLQEGGTIRGHVVDRDSDAAVRDVIVGVYDDQSLIEEDATDSEGRFAIARLAPGRYTVRMRSRTHLPDERSVTLAPSRYEAPSLDLANVRLIGAGVIRGTVTDAVNEPVANARVYVPFMVNGPFAMTNAQGQFELRNVAPGSHEIYAEHRIAGVGRGYRPVRVDALEEAEGADVRLSGRAGDDESTPGSGIVRGVAIDVEDSDTGVRVRWIGPLSAAELSGIRIGDVLTAVDGELVETALQARGLLRGPSSVRAAITVLRGASERRILIAREQYRPAP